MRPKPSALRAAAARSRSSGTLAPAGLWISTHTLVLLYLAHEHVGGLE